MNIESQRNKNKRVYSLDEMDPFDLVRLLYKRRRYIIIITLAGLISSIIFVILKPEPPVTYTGYAEMQIGKVAGVNIQSTGDIYAHLKSDSKISKLLEADEVKVVFKDLHKEIHPEKRGRVEIQTKIFTIKTITDSSNRAKKNINEVTKNILSLHNYVYTEALTEYKQAKQSYNSFNKRDARLLPILWLNTYTYPTKVIHGPTVEINPPEENDLVHVVVTTFSALVVAIICVLLSESIRLWRREEQNGKKS